MNKKLITLISTTLLMFPVLAFAFGVPLPNYPISISDAIDRIFLFIWPLFIAFAIIMFIVAGFIYLTAHGEPGKVKTAGQAVMWGAVGVGVGVLAFSIPTIVSVMLGA